MNVRSFDYEGFDLAKASLKLEAFDGPKHVPVQPPAPRPMFSTEDLELAKTLAREEGIREGQDQAKKQYETEKNSDVELQKVASAKVLEEINAQLGKLAEEGQNGKNKFSEKLSGLALAIAQKVCGDVADKVISAQISAIINESVARLDGGDKIKIHLNAKNAAALEGKFAGCIISVDDKMETGDFRIEWQNGYGERDVKELWQSIGEICSRQSSLEENEETNLNKGE